MFHIQSYNRSKVMTHYFLEVRRYKCNIEFSKFNAKRVISLVLRLAIVLKLQRPILIVNWTYQYNFEHVS